ncbi:WYL domain-containing protein [Pectobacterium parmentieri]|uniref:WYL domain-containing protein n=1 Tax=Pectobacterium parmentieri TaxID=1905730 RepID=A0A8B3FGQ2_PECPM|nr:WYL domain-containing protein [Pectobacterium parmentieri]MBI0549935.1 WYL domain-containing protein [Pectobacterium parmentieri]MBI0558983.1 WYL domain-containing protein [Pectobacterium parmentieri]MBI0564292.1 WYL domain-containing protein [Pectobacterium parmentieri]PWD56411.1 WYL domain-containing protein [Pectobacterium parmentieri]RKO78529.1 WYL domain-containing protein [Pectobacterium parmentieri]
MTKTSAAGSDQAVKGRSWGLERRLQFIDFRLRWNGHINRTDLTSFFGLSIPQASLDIAKYIEIAPYNLIYDRRTKTYTATPTFSAVYPQNSAQRYLAELLAMKTGVLEADASFIESAPEVCWIDAPLNTYNEQVVEVIVRAIREKKAVSICYQSSSSMDNSPRLISPHALGNDGLRWRVRAYCHIEQQFADFTLTRILSIENIEPSTVDPAGDYPWHTYLQLILAPSDKLPPAHQRALELEYGMTHGELNISCRLACLHETLRRFHINLTDENGNKDQLFILKNKEEIQVFPGT